MFFASIIVAVVLFRESSMAQVPGVTANVLQRVKRIIAGPVSGTAFTIEVDGRQYIITAKHVVATLTGDTSTIQLCENEHKCADISVKVLRCSEPIDIAVLVPPKIVTATHKLDAELKSAIIGQDMYFVGFPYADYSLTTNTRTEVIGFVRKVIFSAQERKNEYTRLYLDGRNNSGFSGAPVVYVESGKTPIEFKVAGVISGYRTDFSKVKKIEPIENKNITKEDRALNLIIDYPDGTHRKLVDTDMIISDNTGIIVAYAIEHAIDLIKNSSTKGPEIK